MKSSEKALRKELRGILHDALEPSIRQRASDALAAFERTDIERLRGRLMELREEAGTLRVKTSYDTGWLDAINHIMYYVESELGVGEGSDAEAG